MVNEKLKKLLPPRSFRFAFTLMYVGVISAVVGFSLIGQCQTQFISTQTGWLLIVLISLIGLEQWERARYGDAVPLRPAVAFLLLRIVLVQIVVAVDCSGYAAFLYPVIPFSAYFSLGPHISNLLALATGIFYVWQYRPLAFSGEGGVFNLMIFAILMLFMLLIARIIDSDERNHQNLELLLADLEASNVKLQLYADQVAELAATEERNRLARDIHDSLGHRLTVVAIQLEKALAYKDRDPAEAEQAILDAKQAASAALREVRRSVRSLRDTDEAFSLRMSLAELVDEMENGRFSISYTFSGDEASYSRSVLMALYRSAQEGLTNIQKHAEATAVSLTASLEEAEGKLILQDNGRGFDATTLDDLAVDPHDSFGLQGIQERLELVRGQMQVISQPEKGTILQITVPRNPTILEVSTMK